MNTTRSTENSSQNGKPAIEIHETVRRRTACRLLVCGMKQCGELRGNCDKCVSCMRSAWMRPLRFAKALQQRCAPPLQAPPLVRRRQVLILHLRENHKIRLTKGNKDFDTITCFAGQCSAFMYSWIVLGLRSMPAACRRLRSLATEQHDTVAIQTLISDAARTRH